VIPAVTGSIFFTVRYHHVHGVLYVTLPHERSAIAGAQELCDWFGYWPAFHDAEIIGPHLNRTGFSSLTVHAWQMTKELDEEGYCVQTKHVVVEFIPSGVSGWI
jgi:hypothetical protein